MDLKSYLRTMQGTSKENTVLRIAVFALILSNMVLAFAATSVEETVVMVPPYLVGSERIGPDEASAGLKESWAQHVAMLLGNVTPATSKHLKDQVARITAPRAQSELLRQIDEQVTKIQDERLTISFTPSSVFYLRGIDRVVVSGNYAIRGARAEERTMIRTYEMGFEVESHAVVLTSIKVYEGAWNAQEYAAAQAARNGG